MQTRQRLVTRVPARGWLAVLCLLAVVAAACSDDDESTAPDTPDAAETTTANTSDGESETEATDTETEMPEHEDAGLVREGEPGSFDLVNGNAMHGILIPRLGPWASTEVSPALNDASVVFRYTVQMYSAAFDAVAPYDETAVGIFSRIARRPASESEDNLLPNTAVMHALYRLMLDFAPHRTDEWRAILTDYGLDPDDESGLDWDCDASDRTEATAVAIGNLAARCTLDARRHDGFNQFGDINGVDWLDTTGYVSVNPPHELNDPSRWQPLILPFTDGVFRAQRFVTPQWANVEPFALFDPREYRVVPPEESNHANADAYLAQAQEVLDESANLDDFKKEIVMFFDNKLRASQILPDVKHIVDIVDFIQVSFLVEMASHDVGVVVWQEKQRHDAVRPVTAIRHLFADETVTAWGGPGQGTVEQPGSHWRSFANTADHPEYPSATTAFCGAYAQALRRYAGVEDDTGGYAGIRPAGSNPIEPGISPAEDLELNFETWSEYEDLCAASRVWGGVHFWPAVEVSIPLGNEIGDLAYEYWATLMDGSAPMQGPAQPLPRDPMLDEPHSTGR